MKLSKVGLSTIKRQHSKKSDMMDRSRLDQKDMKKLQIFCKFFSQKVFKMSNICTDTCLEMLSSRTAVSIMSGHKSDHRPTLLNCKALSLLRTVNEQKEKMLIFCMVLILSLIHIWRCRRIERCRSRWSPYH